MSRSAQSRSNSWLPIAARRHRPKSRAVSALPLSVSTRVIFIGLNRLGLPEAELTQSSGHGFGIQCHVEVALDLCGWDVPDRLEQAPVVEPVDPSERRVFHGLEATPPTVVVNVLGLEQAVQCQSRHCHSCRRSADGWLDASSAKPLPVPDAQALETAVRMGDEPHAFHWPALMDGMLQRIPRALAARRHRT